MDASKYIYAFLIFVVIGLSTCYGQFDKFLKYSTAGFSISFNSELQEQEQYQIIDGELLNITPEHKGDMEYTIFLRKLARFDYQKKGSNFYYGNEDKNISTIGAVKGLEYYLSYNYKRERGLEFHNKDFWLRYLSSYFVVKGQYSDNQYIDLEYGLGDIRGRYNLGKFDVTLGACFRTHGVYGYNPFAEHFSSEQYWWEIAYDFGYEDEYWYYDGEQNGVDDYYDYYNWNWYEINGTDTIQIASTDQEFRKYHFTRAINEYNEREIKALGLQRELSAVAGVSFYHYTNQFWLHTWGNVLFAHKGLDDYSYDYPDSKLDYDSGVILGVKIGKHLGFFTEGNYLRYWDRKLYAIKLGINYIFK